MKKTSRKPNSSQARNILERLNILCTKMKEIEQQYENERTSLLDELKYKQLILENKQQQTNILMEQYKKISEQYNKRIMEQQQHVNDELMSKCYDQMNTEREQLEKTLLQLQTQNQYNEQLFETYYNSLGLEPYQDFLEQAKRAQEHLLE